jgi:hypothetical protein
MQKRAGQLYWINTFRKIQTYFKHLAQMHRNSGNKISGASWPVRMPSLLFVFVKHYVPLKQQETDVNS